MASRSRGLLLIAGVQLLVLVAAAAGSRWQDFLRLPSDVDDAAAVGTRWAVLIAGSNGYYNYRHQADVCHAYQVLKQGGLKDENIIVFMYDDIAGSPENPRPGVIINHPAGGDVYAGVPKDYTGSDVNVHNFLAVLLGDSSAVTLTSSGDDDKDKPKKVVASGPADHVFVYYSDHGGPGVLGMPSGEYLYADDLVDALKTKHAAGGFASLVFYLEACESGSIFQGLLPPNISVYATTAANADESSWATYCPGDDDPVAGATPPEFDTCLGDLYSVAWMEDSDAHDRRAESLRQQYQAVRDRTDSSSHAMEFGDLHSLAAQTLDTFIGNDDEKTARSPSPRRPSPPAAVTTNQRDADLVYFWRRYRRAAEGTAEKAEARARLAREMERRAEVDGGVERVGGLLLGTAAAEEEEGRRPVLAAVRAAGQPLADDWGCLKSVVRAYERHCGPLGQYGMKHMRAFANICNAGVGEDAMAEVASRACAAAADAGAR